ncbi:hypothetical protein D9M68_883630 [compost metagenome]
MRFYRKLSSNAIYMGRRRQQKSDPQVAFLFNCALKGAMPCSAVQLNTTLLRRRRYVATTGSSGGICPSATFTFGGSITSRIAM